MIENIARYYMIIQIERLEEAITQHQQNQAAEVQGHQTTVIRLEERLHSLENDLALAGKRAKGLEEDLQRRGDTIMRLEADVKVLKESLSNKVEEVSQIQ